MAAEHCQAGYWVVWFQGWTSEHVEAPTHVEHVETFEQARARYAALEAAQVASVEVYGADGAVLLSEALSSNAWSMTQPRAAGSYRWNDKAEAYEAVQTADDASPCLVG